MNDSVFNVNVPFFNIIYKFVILFLLGILWFICSLPIITIGASTTALYYTIVKAVRHERGPIYKTFFSSFQNNFLASLPCTFIVLLLSGLLIMGIVISSQITSQLGNYTFIPYIVAVPLLPIVLILPYLYPVLSRFDYKTKFLFQNCFYISVKHFPSTLLFLVILTGCILLFIWMPNYAICTPGIACFVISIQMEKIFRLYMPKPEGCSTDELPWYWE